MEFNILYVVGIILVFFLVVLVVLLILGGTSIFRSSVKSVITTSDVNKKLKQLANDDKSKTCPKLNKQIHPFNSSAFAWGSELKKSKNPKCQKAGEELIKVFRKKGLNPQEYFKLYSEVVDKYIAPNMVASTCPNDEYKRFATIVNDMNSCPCDKK